MHRKTAALLLIVMVLAILLTGCGKSADIETKTTQGYLPSTEEFIGSKFAVTVGTVYDQLAQGHFQAKELVYVKSNIEALEAVRTGKANVMMLNEVMARDVLADSKYSELTSINMSSTVVFPEGVTNDISVLSCKQDVINAYNEFLAEIKGDGTLEQMKNRWLMGGALPDKLPDIPITGENGNLEIAITGEKVPFDFLGADGEYLGFEVEQLTRFAAYLGKKPVFHAMAFGAIIPYVESGKADLGASDFNITEERRQYVLFGDPYMHMGYVLVFPKANFGLTDSTSAELSLDSFNGKSFSITMGTGFENLAMRVFGTSMNDILLFDDISVLEVVIAGKVDCAIVDLTYVIPVLKQEHFSSLGYYTLPDDIAFDQYAAVSNDASYIEQFNRFLKVVKADGTFDDMISRWVDNFDPDNPPEMPGIPTTGENGVLKVATSSICMPFVMKDANNDVTGLEVELMKRFAASLGKTAEFTDLAYDALMPCVKSGKCDISAAMYFFREERAENVMFTDPYYDARTAVVYRKADFESNAAAQSWEDFRGKSVAVMVGTVYDKTVENVFHASERLYFESETDVLEAIESGKAEAMLIDGLVWQAILTSGKYKVLEAVDVPLDDLIFQYGVMSADQDWIQKYNAWLESAKNDGTYDEMSNRWLKNFTYDTVVPDIATTGENGTLKVAIFPSAPFNFIGKSGAWQGFDIEQFVRFAASLGMNVQFEDMEFAGLLPYVAAGKADFGASAYMTAERAKQIHFGDCNAESGTMLIYKKQEISAASPTFNFVDWVKKGVENNLIKENRYKMMVSGLGVTLQITLLSQLFGTILGALVAFMMTRKAKAPIIIANVYSGFIHGTPMVVLLMIAYYIIFGKSDVNSIVIAVAAFAIVEGVGIGGALKTAIQTVDTVEIEAARSMGYSAFGAFRRVTLPQAVKVALPGYLNGFVELMKATAIVGYIAIQDLSRAGDIIRSRTYDAYFPLLFVAVVYLIMTLLCAQLFKYLIRRVVK